MWGFIGRYNVPFSCLLKVADSTTANLAGVSLYRLRRQPLLCPHFKATTPLLLLDRTDHDGLGSGSLELRGGGFTVPTGVGPCATDDFYAISFRSAEINWKPHANAHIPTDVTNATLLSYIMTEIPQFHLYLLVSSHCSKIVMKSFCK